VRQPDFISVKEDAALHSDVTLDRSLTPARHDTLDAEALDVFSCGCVHRIDPRIAR
jgi:hypothetical protein